MSERTERTFRTERLWLRPMAASDADDLHAVRGDDAAMRWWYAGTATSVDVTRQETADMATWGTHWVFGAHGDDTVLGYVGFYGLGPGEGCGFGYLLRRDHWGRGLTVEAARALLGFGFGEVGIRHAELWIDPGNSQSQRVAQKLGARFRGWALTGSCTLVFGVTRDEWEGGEGRPLVIEVTPTMQVSDLPRALALWCDGLGFRVGFDTGVVAHVRAEWTGGPGVRLRRGSRFDGHALVTVGTEVDAVAARAAAAGWTVASSPEDQPWGAREALLRDPDGNEVWLTGLPAGSSD